MTYCRYLWTYHIGLEAWLILPVKQLSPIDAVEEWMRLDLCGTVDSEPLRCIPVQETGQKIASSRWHNLWPGKMERFGQYLAVHVVCVLVVERRQTRQHLVEEDTQSPPIDSLGVAGAMQKLGCEVFGRTAECCPVSVSCMQCLTKITHCLSCLHPSCLACTGQSRKAQCDQCNLGGYFRASDHGR